MSITENPYLVWKIDNRSFTLSALNLLKGYTSSILSGAIGEADVESFRQYATGGDFDLSEPLVKAFEKIVEAGDLLTSQSFFRFLKAFSVDEDFISFVSPFNPEITEHYFKFVAYYLLQTCEPGGEWNLPLWGGVLIVRQNGHHIKLNALSLYRKLLRLGHIVD